jgi:hypothetical protein
MTYRINMVRTQVPKHFIESLRVTGCGNRIRLLGSLGGFDLQKGIRAIEPLRKT